MKEWFKARYVWGAAFETLTDEEAGRLVKALWTYAVSGQQTELPATEKGILAMIQMTLDQDNERDAETSAKRSRNGAIGGRIRAENQANAKLASENKVSQANAEPASENEANQANACNKNKNKNKSKSKNKSIEKAQEREKRFDRFWEVYPRKVAKQEARKAFARIDPDEALLNTMIAAIGKWKRTEQWTEDGDRYIPHPATWLNQRRWEDELPKPGAAGVTVTAQKYEQRDYSGVQEELMARQDQEMEEWLKEGEQAENGGEEAC